MMDNRPSERVWVPAFAGKVEGGSPLNLVQTARDGQDRLAIAL
jgi:hypothetical protein